MVQMPNLSRGPYCLIVPLFAVLITVAVTALAADSQHPEPPKPGKSHKCPVCGMLVHRYPDFVASITFSDHHMVFFDGVKDMLKYYFNLPKYAPNRKAEEIRDIFVTEYYDMHAMDARKAIYVLGSDVFGPMGHELIPLRSLDDARMFRKDHKGRRIVRFKEITPALIRQLD